MSEEKKNAILEELNEDDLDEVSGGAGLAQMSAANSNVARSAARAAAGSARAAAGSARAAAGSARAAAGSARAAANAARSAGVIPGLTPNPNDPLASGANGFNDR